MATEAIVDSTPAMTSSLRACPGLYRPSPRTFRPYEMIYPDNLAPPLGLQQVEGDRVMTCNGLLPNGSDRKLCGLPLEMVKNAFETLLELYEIENKKAETDACPFEATQRHLNGMLNMLDGALLRVPHEYPLITHTINLSTTLRDLKIKMTSREVIARTIRDYMEAVSINFVAVDWFKRPPLTVAHDIQQQCCVACPMIREGKED